MFEHRWKKRFKFKPGKPNIKNVFSNVSCFIPVNRSIESIDFLYIYFM